MGQKLAKRIQELRISRHWSQVDLAAKISDVIDRENNVTQSSVSMWETGRRDPSFEIIIALTHIFDCSVNYLRGVSNNRYDTDNVEKSPYEINPNLYKLDAGDLARFDRQPVWIESPDQLFESQWVIVNLEEQSLIGVNRQFAMDEKNIQYFSFPLPNATSIAYYNNMPLNYEQFQNTQTFWVEIKSTSVELRSIYNGWWKHNEQHTAIINENGYVLPYNGYNKSYLVYKQPFQELKF